MYITRRLTIINVPERWCRTILRTLVGGTINFIKHVINKMTVILVRYDPMASDLVHHMLLYGCKLPYSNHKTWCVDDTLKFKELIVICRDCKGMGRLCGTGQPYILFGWGRNASGIQLPTGVGFRVGERTDINWLVLQLHYGDKVNSAKNHTGIISLLKCRALLNASRINQWSYHTINWQSQAINSWCIHSCS